jgi:serpin B
MAKDKKGENLIISPLSIFQALSLAANGAKEQTRSEMLDLLQCYTIDELNKINFDIISKFKEFSTIDIANAVMTTFTPLKDFTTIAEKYSAPIEPLVSLEQVNNWCRNKTHGKIDKILDVLDPRTLMVILNAVYFKGEWVTKFHSYQTKKLPFYNLGSEEIKIDTMNRISRYKYYEDKKVQAIELRFEKDFMSALIILPSEGTDINKYIDTLSISNDEYNKIIDGLNFVKVNLELPKFELEFKEQLNQVLIDLGMFNAFDEFNADFTGLRPEGQLFINQVVHKTYLKVFEDGCEAAAVTAIEVATNSVDLPEKIYDMKINRPFLFLLKNSELPEGYDLVFMSKIEKLK